MDDITHIVEDDQDFEYAVPDTASDFEWEEGVEKYQDVTEDTLWEWLGCLNKRALPFFNLDIDRLGLHNPWEHPDFFSHPHVDHIPLKVRWHQLVGIFKGLQLAFEGKPLLLMDEVGFGKTMQVIGIIAMLAFFQEYYAKHGDFPGAFS